MRTSDTMNITRSCDPPRLWRRRHAGSATGALVAAPVPSLARAESEHPSRRWFEAAEAMRQLAPSWGDELHGAVLVTAYAVVGEGPSRVVKHADTNAHA
jgi:hypothetical protein